MLQLQKKERIEMARTISVEIDIDTAVNMLMERLSAWTNDKDTQKAFEQMYRENCEDGLYDGGSFDIMQIVDNDWVNWICVVDKSEVSKEDWNALKKLGRGDLSEANSSLETLDCGNTGFLEVITNNTALIRQ